MAGEIFVTFGFLSVVLGVIGCALVVTSEIVGRIEDRRNEIAYRNWVEKYGVSGRK